MGNRIDITGQRFGKLTAIEPTEERRNRAVVWKCECTCGNECFVATNNLRSGSVKSCGCLRKEMLRNRKGCKKKNLKCDIAGKQFGRLTAIEPTENRKYGQVIWKCECACGNIHYTTRTALTQGHSQSCGCLLAESQAMNWLRKRFKTKDEAVTFVQENFDITNES